MASLGWQPLVVVLAACALAQLVRGGGKTLVLLDDDSIAYTHSNFFDSLKSKLPWRPALASGTSLFASAADVSRETGNWSLLR